jgi:hypothetical protein
MFQLLLDHHQAKTVSRKEEIAKAAASAFYT